MPLKIVFRDKALKEMYQTFWWYEEHKIALGELFLERIDAALIEIKANPESFQQIYKKFRHFPLKKFPFVIVYKIYDTEIVIYALFHTKRSPKRKF
jgi:hypothetical protein